MAELWSVMWVPFLTCVVLVLIHGYLGMHVLSRGIIFVDLALAQFAALGSILALLFEHEVGGQVSYGLSLGFTLVGAVVFSWTRTISRAVPQEAFIGVAWVVASSAAILIVSGAPHGAEHIESMLVGSILWVSPREVLEIALICTVISLFHWFYRARFFRITMQPESAASDGISLQWWDFLFYASFGIVVTSAVKVAGVLLVFSFLIIPSVVGLLFAHSVRARLLVGWSFGVLFSILGCVVSYVADLPTGASIVCTLGVALLLLVLARAALTRH